MVFSTLLLGDFGLLSRLSWVGLALPLLIGREGGESTPLLCFSYMGAAPSSLFFPTRGSGNFSTTAE